MDEPVKKSRKRVLLYVFDGGSGIGHLRRISGIAAELKKDFACLIVTGHNVGPQWMVPSGCEYVRLPAWDSLIPAKAAYWGNQPFLNVTLSEAVALRQSMISGVIEGFKPDILIVDHLPLGANDELKPFVERPELRKYLVTRSVQNETEDLQRLVFGGDAMESLRSDYQAIFSAIDSRVFNLAQRYDFPAVVQQKIVPVGYVGPHEELPVRDEVRKRRGIPEGAIWVVVSAGGGQWGEPLMRAALELASTHENIYFDIVLGPRSSLAIDEKLFDESHRVSVRLSCANLASLHAAADLVVTTAGYNSLLETLKGEARILCVPYRTDPSDEPLTHARGLATMVDIAIEADLNRLPMTFSDCLSRCQRGPVSDARKTLDMSGARRIAGYISSEMRTTKDQDD